MRTLPIRVPCAVALVLAVTSAIGQSGRGELRLRIVPDAQLKHAIPAVAWLRPIGDTPALPFPPAGSYTLLQKNRTFIPHLQVVPVGSVVHFPNADPFFHNVFSLFDGKRFDLGLYEAGTSKSVTFSREGISYIFCNIHPEMSAVIVSLSTSAYGIANPNDEIEIRNVPFGNYQLEVWVEGAPASTLRGLERDVHLDSGVTDLGDVRVKVAAATGHMNKFGAPYPSDHTSPY